MPGNLTDLSSRLSPVQLKLIRLGLLFSIFGVVAWIALLDFLPPVDRDALIQHLAVPKLWLKAGAMVDIPWAAFSYYPMNVDILYLLPLALGADWAAKFIHHLFALLTALLIYLYLHRRLGSNWAVLGSLIFLSTPIIMRLAAMAYVDLGLVFFITGSWMALSRWASSGRRIFFILSAASLGLALGSKYNALIAPVILTPAVMVIRARAGDGFWRCIAWGAVYSLLSLAVFSPWMIRNFTLTGNPIYPLFNGLWGLPSLNPAGLKFDVFTLRRFLYDETLPQTMLVPVRAFFSGQDNSPQFFDGVLNPALLLFPLAALIKPREKETGALAFLAFFWVAAVFFQASFRVRYMAPILPVLAVLTVFGLRDGFSLLSRRLRFKPAAVLGGLVVIGFLSLNAVWAGEYWRKTDPSPFLLGRETRAEYLTRKLPYYPMMEYINQNLPLEANILFLFAGDQGYYCDRNYFFHTYYSGEALRPALASSISAEELRTRLTEGSAGIPGATHILTRRPLLDDYLTGNFSREKLRVWVDFANNYLALLHQRSDYVLYGIKNSPPAGEE